MASARRFLSSVPRTFSLAGQGVRTWGRRQVLVAAGVALAFGLVLGLATVLIPNPVFAREIPPVWWNYPVWILTSVMSGMLVATYVQSPPALDQAAGAGARRSSRLGFVGAMLAWFAVGCPVCNKLALLALGYSGAISWFAPVQPFLAVAALVLTAVALVVRLRGKIECVLPESQISARGVSV